MRYGGDIGARLACLRRSAASTGLSSEKQMYTVAQLQKRCMTESSCSCWCRQSSSTNAFMKRLLSWCRSLPVTAEMLYRCAASWMSVWHTDVVKVCSSLWCPWWSTVLSRSNAMSDRRVSKRCARSRSSSSRASSNGGWRSAVCASPAGMAGSEQARRRQGGGRRLGPTTFLGHVVY